VTKKQATTLAYNRARVKGCNHEEAQAIVKCVVSRHKDTTPDDDVWSFICQFVDSFREEE